MAKRCVPSHRPPSASHRAKASGCNCRSSTAGPCRTRPPAGPAFLNPTRSTTHEEQRVSITQQQSAEHLTRYVSDFICSARLEDLPQDVVTLGKKSILDGLGLALSGGASHCGALVRRHLA